MLTGRAKRDHNEAHGHFGGDGYVHYLDCGDKTCQNLSNCALSVQFAIYQLYFSRAVKNKKKKEKNPFFVET